MRCEACGCEDRWCDIDKGFMVCECGHEQEPSGIVYDIASELMQRNHEYGQLSNKYAKLKYDYEILLKKLNYVENEEYLKRVDKTEEEIEREYNLIIDDEGVKINGTLINEEIFNEEKVDYFPRERADQIDHLIDWIGDCGRDRENDKYLMKEDLKMLRGWEDEFIFSSILTNEYIAKSQDEEEFNNICEEILKLNSELNKHLRL